MTLSRFLCTCAVVVAVMGVPSTARAQAYCALRDPVQTIYLLYPAATGYQSIVATVGEAARADITQRFGLELHHSELGRHTLYVAVAGKTPIGLVHVRSERTQWGLAEVAWALDFDLRVVDFRIQRSRSTSRAALESETFRSWLRGRTVSSLAALLAPGGARLNPGLPRMPVSDETLAAAIVASGIKAIAATESVWRDDIRRLRALASAQTGR